METTATPAIGEIPPHAAARCAHRNHRPHVEVVTDGNTCPRFRLQAEDRIGLSAAGFQTFPCVRGSIALMTSMRQTISEGALGAISAGPLGCMNDMFVIRSCYVPMTFQLRFHQIGTSVRRAISGVRGLSGADDSALRWKNTMHACGTVRASHPGAGNRLQNRNSRVMLATFSRS
jgi:hypothetical protein